MTSTEQCQELEQCLELCQEQCLEQDVWRSLPP
jgi:hypothetical protein